MRALWLLVSFLLGSLCVRGQDDSITLDEVIQSANQWAKENLDDETLRALQSVDRDKVKDLFSQVEKQFHGQYVVDMAAVKDAAAELLPLLESSEESRPYAAWLRARLDYVEVAEQIKRTTPPPKVEPGHPPEPAVNPSAEKEREIWTRKVSERPWPPAANSYVTSLKPVFLAQKVPPELVWVAEVESSFNPKALSPVGAVGLYQLMPATAKRFGLTLSPSDQRLLPEASARAAAKYFGLLHRQFKDWRLAIAAYNAGEGTIQKLLDRHQARSFDAIAPYLPAETQMYVPKIEATIARREGVKLAQL
jgi:membrane-bound lytic murein transglycosylase D